MFQFQEFHKNAGRIDSENLFLSTNKIMNTGYIIHTNMSHLISSTTQTIHIFFKKIALYTFRAKKQFIKGKMNNFSCGHSHLICTVELSMFIREILNVFNINIVSFFVLLKIEVAGSYCNLRSKWKVSNLYLYVI